MEVEWWAIRHQELFKTLQYYYLQSHRPSFGWLAPQLSFFRDPFATYSKASGC